MEQHYCVIFTQTLRQWNVTEAIRRALPEDRGTVFYPCAELWMGSLGRTVIEPLFPGYVFIRSDMGRRELHEFIKVQRREILSFIKELWVNERRIDGEDAFGRDEDDVADLDDDEAELLDFMLGFRNGGDAVLRMSYGYRERDGRCVVMEGPLRGHEDRIVDTNPRDRRAYLSLKVGGRLARAGLTIRGKKYWFPEDKDAPDMLGDGTEIDCVELARILMGTKNPNRKRHG